MPRITQFTAEKDASIANLSNRAVPYNDFSGLEYAGKSAAELGHETVGVGGELARARAVLERDLLKNQESINLTDMQTLYEAGSKNIHQEITTPAFDEAGNLTREAVPAFQQHQAFLAREKELRDDIAKTAITPNVALGFRKFVGGFLPLQSLKVKHDADLQIVAGQKASVEQQLLADAQKIGQELDPVVRDNMKTSSAAAQTLENTKRLFGPEQAVKMKHAWEQRIEESNMRTVGDKFGYEEVASRIAQGDWTTLDSSKRISIADHYRSIAEHRDNLQDKVDKKLNAQTYAFYMGLAGEGKLDPFRESLKSGLVPGLTRQQQATLYNTKELGIDKKEGQAEADQIVIDFNKANPADYRKNAAIALDKLRELSLENPKSLHVVRQNMDHIRAVERQMDGQVRAVEGAGRAVAGAGRAEDAASRAKVEFNVKRFKDFYNSQTPRPLIDVLGSDKNRRIQDINEGEYRVRIGEDWDKVSKEISERYRRERDAPDNIDRLQEKRPPQTAPSMRVPTPLGTGSVDLLLRTQ